MSHKGIWIRDDICQIMAIWKSSVYMQPMFFCRFWLKESKRNIRIIRCHTEVQTSSIFSSGWNEMKLIVYQGWEKKGQRKWRAVLWMFFWTLGLVCVPGGWSALPTLVPTNCATVWLVCTPVQQWAGHQQRGYCILRCGGPAVWGSSL